MSSRAPRGVRRSARAERRPLSANPDGRVLLATFGGLVTAVSTALPWYVADIGEPFRDQTASGIGSGAGGKVVLALAILLTLVGAALVADARGSLPLDRGIASALTAVAAACAAGCAAIVAYRLLAPPPELNSRDYGLYFAAAGSGAALLAAIGQLLRR